MGRIGRSFELVGQSYRVLMQDKELMVLPLVSGVLIIGVAVSFFFGAGLGDRIDAFDRSAPDAAFMIPMFALYVLTYAIGIFFQAAVIAGATERLRGGDPTVGSALAAASRKILPILMWAVVAATVGMLLRAIQDRAGFIGKIVVGIIGAAWSLATFFVVPVIVLEESSIGESFGRSLGLFKKTWGEQFVGGASIGIAAVCAWVTLVAVVGLLAWAGIAFAAFAVGAAGAVFLAVLFPTLQGVFVASLYQYATQGGTPRGFDAQLLSQAFVRKH
ncbi:MAG TPA: DUF6159 family protein [Vicinamibacterales bacterium]|nr:DUF6159 family protein [Vicinamibacterales bacterium]